MDCRWIFFDEDESKDKVSHQRWSDKYTEKADELSDTEDEEKTAMAFAASQTLYVAVINSITEVSNRSLG